MRRWLIPAVILVAGVALPLGLVGGGDAAAGKAVYTKKCATCHALAGEPKEAIAKMMKVEMRHLGAKPVQAKSDAELRKITTDGSGKMKPVKGLSEQDLDNVIAYVRTLAKEEKKE